MKKYYFIPLKIVISEDEYHNILQGGPEKILKYGITSETQAKYIYELLVDKEGLTVVEG